jgi:hypothetical protein
MANDREELYARARRAYERGRAIRATSLAAPLAALSVLGLCLGASAATAITVGAALLATTWIFTWRGRALGRSVLPGVFAGLVPLALAAGARSYGHMCAGGQCISLCIPACTCGGLIAGLLIARLGRRSESPVRFFVGAGSLAVMVGALGCSCVGFGGIMGLGFGLVATLVPKTFTSARAS